MTAKVIVMCLLYYCPENMFTGVKVKVTVMMAPQAPPQALVKGGKGVGHSLLTSQQLVKTERSGQPLSNPLILLIESRSPI